MVTTTDPWGTSEGPVYEEEGNYSGGWGGTDQPFEWQGIGAPPPGTYIPPEPPGTYIPPEPPTPAQPTSTMPTSAPSPYPPYSDEDEAMEEPPYPQPPATSEWPTSTISPTGSPTGSTTTTTTSYAGEVPTVPTVQPFEAPEWDERAIARLKQARAAPGLRRLRRAAERASTRYYENPNVKRMTMRAALEGLGGGMAEILAGAGKEAAAEYCAKYSRQYGAAAMSYQAQMQQQQMAYQTLLAKYMAGRTTTTTTQQTYAPPTTTAPPGVSTDVDEVIQYDIPTT